LNQTEAARAELQRSHDALAQQIANLTKPAPEAAPETGQVAEVAKVEPPPSPGQSLTLSTEMLRRDGQRVRMPTIFLPARGPSVRLQLILPRDGNESGRYDAAVRSAEGQEPIFTEKNLKLTKRADGTIVVVALPSRLIQSDDYTVTLYKSGADLSGEGIASYVFRAQQP
jgi:hypothetical protein